MYNSSKNWKKVTPPLKKVITCTSSECKSNLHNFRTNMRKKINKSKTYRNESCIDCDKKMIDWDRIDKKNLGDHEYLITSLNYELIRHTFWTKPIDRHLMKNIRTKTISELRSDVTKILKKTLSAPSNKQFRDGIQTPKEGNIIYYAQHATATCCRKCFEEWYNIDKNKKLNDNHLKYPIEIVMIYLKKRIPGLEEDK